MKKLTLAIDFDNTIVEEKYPLIGVMIKDAKKYINKLYADGHYIIINTCRVGEQELQAADWLYDHGVNFHAININQPARVLKYGGDCRKISADLYVDDKNVGGLPSWKEIYEQIQLKANGTS